MKNSTIRITYLNQTKQQFVQNVVEIQKKLAATFMDAKKVLHETKTQLS